MINYLGENTFETNKNWFLINSTYKCCITKELILAKELILIKVTKARNVGFGTIGFLIMGLNFSILSAIYDINNFAMIAVTDVDYCCIIHDISKSEAINSLLGDRGYKKNIVRLLVWRKKIEKPKALKKRAA